jgi:hypothetical protein
LKVETLRNSIIPKVFELKDIFRLKNLQEDFHDNRDEYISNEKNAFNSLSNKLESILKSI